MPYRQAKSGTRIGGGDKNHMVNKPDKHYHYRIEWKNGRITFYFRNKVLHYWEIPKMDIRYILIGKDNQYPHCTPEPIFHNVEIGGFTDIPPTPTPTATPEPTIPIPTPTPIPDPDPEPEPDTSWYKILLAILILIASFFI